MSDLNQANSSPSAGSQPSALPLIPWRHVLTATAGLIAAALFGLPLAGEAGALAAVAGFMIGLYASMSQGYRNAGLVGAMVALAAAISLRFPGTLSIITGSLLLLGFSSWESVQTGSRACVMGLLGYLMFTIGIDFGGDWAMLIPYAFGVVIGMAVVAYLGFARLLPATPVSLAAAVALALFIGIGLSVSLFLIEQLDQQRSYWIMLIFVGRALTPFQGFQASTLRYGSGALAGAAIAFLILLLGLPTPVNIVLALTAGVFGIRTLTHPLPIASGLFTLSVLLLLESSQQETLFRVFSVTIAVVLALGLSLLIGWLWRYLNRRFPRHVSRLYPTPEPESSGELS
ncbi:MAG: hypothetical protein AAF633_03930 [Chloroflexota bacterium]